jgi:hypothetical protein
MDVPDRSTYESRLAAKMLTPGAAMSGCRPSSKQRHVVIYTLIHEDERSSNTHAYITLSTEGNSALGPLDENVAILGEATWGPTMVAAGEILATLLVTADRQDQITSYRVVGMHACITTCRYLGSCIWFLCPRRVDDAGQVALAGGLAVEDVGTVLLEDDALGPAGDGGSAGPAKLRRGRIVGLELRRSAYHDFPGDVFRPQLLRVVAADDACRMMMSGGRFTFSSVPRVQ